MLNRALHSVHVDEAPGAQRNARVGPEIVIRRRPPTVSAVFDTYWRFAVGRQDIYFKRVRGERAPWTRDPVLATYKFTNAYRAADRVSQYLLRHVIYGGEFGLRDTVLRTLLFKVFNKIETWKFLEGSIGDITEDSFDVDRLDQLLTSASRAGNSIYSAAYIMPSGPAETRKPRKHRTHLELLASLMKECLPERLAEAKSMADAYQLLRALPGIGAFLAYQFVTDLNYSNHLHFSEMDFVVPGPGARDGIRKCFVNLGDYSESDVIKWVSERQQEEFAGRQLSFESLWSRPLQLIDCQNLFCEVDKYARVVHPDISGLSGRTRIKQRFASKGGIETPWFPPKWGLNERICSG